MKFFYITLFAIFTINSLNAQQSANKKNSVLSENVVIANLNYSVLPTSVNNTKSSIALGKFKDKFIIASYQKYPHAKIAVNKYNKQAVPNIMCTDVLEENDLNYPTLFSRLLKSEYNEGAITFNENFTQAYLTRKKDLKSEKYYLYRAELIDTMKGIWTEPVEVLIDNKSIALQNPRLSNKQNVIYFSTDELGGYGGYDIFKAESQDGGKSFKNLTNLGAAVNTANNELTAVEEGNYLYYASDMPGGFGGYDIYRITYKNGKYSHKINLGNKLNTPKDEINLIPITKTEGYFTSSKDKNKVFDIFRYKIHFNNINLTATFVDSEKNTIKNLPVEITNEDGDVVFKGFTNDKGSVLINAEPYTDVNYAYTSDKYFTNEALVFSVVDDTPNQYKIFELQTKGSPNIVVEHKDPQPIDSDIDYKKIAQELAVYFAFDKYNVRTNEAEKVIKIANVLNKLPNLDVIVSGYADIRGSKAYNFKLSQRRINSTVNLLIKEGINENRIIKDPNGSANLFIKCEICTQKQNFENRSVRFKFEERK